MNAPGPSPADVGRQLLQRREDLDLTQQELATRIGISARTVSAVERGINQITKSRRADWERALALTPRTISRAYRSGTPLQPADDAILDATDGADDPRIALIERSQVFTRAEKDHLIEHIRSFAPYQTPDQGRDVG